MLICLFRLKSDSLSVTRGGDGCPLVCGYPRPSDDNKQAGQDRIEDGSGIAPAQLTCSTVVHGGAFTDFFG